MYSFLMTISEKYLYYYTIIKAKGIHDNDIIAISIANLKKKICQIHLSLYVLSVLWQINYTQNRSVESL